MLLRRWVALSKVGDDKAAAETLAALEGIGLDGNVQGEVDALKHILSGEAHKAGERFMNTVPHDSPHDN